MEDVIAAICKKESIRPTSIVPMTGGQVNQVYLINEAVILRIGGQDDALQRFTRETRIIQDLKNQVPSAGILAFGTFENWVYQLQSYIAGEKLYRVWTTLNGSEKDQIIREVVASMRVLHHRQFSAYGPAYDPANTQASWMAYFDARFHTTLADLTSHHLPFPPDLLRDVEGFYDRNKHFIQNDPPCLVHADLGPGNILVKDGHIAAILDFEFALAAPREYELVNIEQYCLYPNDYAEEGHELYCTADFADYFQRIVLFYPEMFASPHLRERINLYSIQSSIHAFYAWGKDHPDMSANARMHPVARASNFMFPPGARLF